MVVALTALFLALGGSAYALVITGKTIRNNTVTGQDIRNGTLRGQGRRQGLPRRRRDQGVARLGTVPAAGIAYGDARFAVVTGAGALARGRSVSSVARTAAGRYQVIFTGGRPQLRVLRHDRRHERRRRSAAGAPDHHGVARART